jgi:hypothetical protein
MYSRQVKRIQKIEKRFIQVASGSTAAVRRQKASLFPEGLNLSLKRFQSLNN